MITNNYYIKPQISPSFQANCRDVKYLGKLRYKTNTWFFRSDLEWDSFVKYVDKRYKKSNSIPVFNFACSDGEESFSLAYKLIQILKNNANKFFPIHASDIDYENIIKAKSFTRYNLDTYEANKIKEFGSSFNEYFEIYYDNKFPIGLKPLDKLRNKIEFKRSDLINEVIKLPKGDKVVFLRNCLPYLSYEQQEFVLNQLNQNLSKKSLLVLGDFDKDSLYSLKNRMLSHGFVPTEIKNVYQKVNNKLLQKMKLFFNDYF